MKIYSLGSNIYSNSCQSDDPKDIAKWLEDTLPKLPLNTAIVIGVRDVPEEIFKSLPVFEGFKEINNDEPTASD